MTDKLADLLTYWLHVHNVLTDWLANLLSGSVTECVTGLLSDWLTCWLTNRLAELLTGLPTNWLDDWLNYLLTDSLTERLIDWLRLPYWIIDLTGFLMYCNKFIMLMVDHWKSDWWRGGGGVVRGSGFKSQKTIFPRKLLINKIYFYGFWPKENLSPRRICANQTITDQLWSEWQVQIGNKT